ncbi:MAG: four helix bundle protein [bacterium]
MNDIQKFEDLAAWQSGMELVQEIYGLTEKFPVDEKNGLTSQMRVTAIKIPSKIAASVGCNNLKITYWYLGIVHGLLHSLETYLKTAVRLHYAPLLEAAPVMEKCKSLERMVSDLFHSS